MTIAFRPLRNPNPLGFPGGVLAGIDWSHPAAKGISRGHGFSGVSSFGGFFSLLSSAVGTKVGSPVGKIDGRLGAVTFFNTGSSDLFSFSGNSTANDIAGTIACICYVGSFAGNQYFFSSAAAAGDGLGFRVNSSGALVFSFSGIVAETSSVVLAANVPYFLVASSSGASGTVSFLAARLDTGAILTGATSASATSNPSDGTYLVGNGPGVSDGLGGGVAAAMFAPVGMSMPQLLAWAADPWAFWYPRRDVMLVGAAAAAFKAYWAQRNNMPVLGTGTY